MRRSAALALLAATCMLPACESVQRTAWQAGLPGSVAEFRVDSVTPRIGYLDTRLSSGSIQRRIFAPGDDPYCRRMLVEGGSVQWARTEPFGPLSDGEVRCPVVGLGDLEAWRDARGRASTSMRPIQSSRTRYTIVHRDENYLYAQGGFSIIGLIGWRPGSDQVIALLPRIEACAPADRDGFASVDFRIAGTPAFAVVTNRVPCPISGIVPAEIREAELPDDD